jgi:hypothetical protein
VIGPGIFGPVEMSVFGETETWRRRRFKEEVC